jgi:hypothetical protein
LASNDIQIIRMCKHLNFISPWDNWAKKKHFATGRICPILDMLLRTT